MAIPNQADFLAHAGNADVAAYVNNGGNFQDWWNNYGVNENRQWQPAGNAAWASAGTGVPSANIDQLQNAGAAYDPAVYGSQDPRLGATDGATMAVGSGPVPEYASRYHEIRNIGTDFGALGMDVPDYSQTAVSTAAHKNPYHYVNSQTGELNRDQLQQEIQSGAFRFNPDYYAAQNPDLAAAGLTSGTDLMNHFLDYGWNEGRNYAIENPNFTSDISNGFGGTVAGVNGSALPQFQDTLGGWNNTGGGGLGGLGGQQQNAFDPAAFQQQMQDMFNNWQTQFQQNQQSQWDNMYSNLNQWGQTAYNGAGAANNGFTAGQPNNVSPVYNPNSGGAQPRNGWGGPLGNNNPWSPTF